MYILNEVGSNKKTILIIIVVFILGVIIGSIGAAFLFRNALYFQVPNTKGIEKITFNRGQNVPQIKVNILIPKNLATEEYYKSLNSVVNGINAIAIENNKKLLPLMNTVKEKSTQGDFSNIIDVIFNVRNEIEKISTMLVSVQEDINNLYNANNKNTINESVSRKTTKIIESANILTNAYTDYLQTLRTTFSGKVPTQDLLNELTYNMKLLTNANTKFKSDVDSLLKILSRVQKK
mgnify:CR=1 FL=1